jgi:prepilin peptidase CpaA
LAKVEEMALDIVRLLLFPALMAFAAVSDLFTMTISNRVSLLLLAGFVLLAAFSGMSLHAVSMHVAAGLTVLAVAFVCFAFGWVGGGDAKLAAVTALWFGFDYLMVYLAYAGLAGGILTVLLLFFRRWPLPASLLSQEWLQRLHDRKSGVPYGIALAIGALMIYPETGWMKVIDLSRFAG